MNSRNARLRLATLEQIRSFGIGHSGRALSSVDLLEELYFGEEHGRMVFAFDPQLPQWEERDFLVLSKVEAWPALLAVLRERGVALAETLPERPDRRVPGVDVTMNASGSGLATAVGLALGLRAQRAHRHVFALAGDYELASGNFWEAVSLAGERKLDRLCLILDENSVKDLHIQERFESFDWKVIRVALPHDPKEILYALLKARVTSRMPVCIWAHTVKSSGVPFAERKEDYEDIVFSDEEMLEAQKHLTAFL